MVEIYTEKVPLGNYTNLGAMLEPQGIPEDRKRRFESIKWQLAHYNRILLPLKMIIKGKERKVRPKQCMASIIEADGLVKVMENIKTKKLSYKGLMICGSVHACPICAYKIRIAKAKEIELVIDRHVEAGGSVILVTGTFPHSREDKLIDLMKKLKAVIRGFHKTMAVMKIKKEIGFVEAIKVVETTYGNENGWHPHSHELWFVKSGIKIEDILDKLKYQWANYCIKRGLEKPSYEQGLTVVEGVDAGAYLTKMGINTSFGLSKEISNGIYKKAIGNRYNSFDLLMKAGQDTENNGWALKCWIDYFEATFGMHFISRFPKLKALYGVDDKSTEEILEEDLDNEIIKGFIEKDIWKKIITHGLRGEVLSRIKLGQNFESVMISIDRLKDIYTLK